MLIKCFKITTHIYSLMVFVGWLSRQVLTVLNAQVSLRWKQDISQEWVLSSSRSSLKLTKFSNLCMHDWVLHFHTGWWQLPEAQVSAQICGLSIKLSASCFKDSSEYVRLTDEAKLITLLINSKQPRVIFILFSAYACAKGRGFERTWAHRLGIWEPSWNVGHEWMC
jgi:hypothetical protein